MQDRFKFRCFFADENKMYFYDYFLPAYCMDEKEAHFMQCTGLKDKNGKLIYEGDIVKIHNDVIAKIIFDKGCFAFTDRVYNQACYWNLHAMEVIGNTYETPELLESN